ncbi:MAG: peptidase [Gammaproteobacteria bacterium]
MEAFKLNNLKLIEEAISLSKQYNIDIDRFIECRGIMRLPDSEIRGMVDLCAESKKGLVMSIGPRATNDIGAFSFTENGKRVGYRNRGMENIIYALEEVQRGIELGVRGFLLYDEGLLYLLNKMREKDVLPKEISFKYSVHAACSNPISARLLEDNGIDSINLMPDVDLNMLSAFRKAVSVPLDLFSDTAKAAGGFIRTYEVAEMIRLASPVYLKCGPVSQPQQNHLPSPVELEERVKQARNVVEHIQRYLPEAKRVSSNEFTLALPKTVLESIQKKVA